MPEKDSAYWPSELGGYEIDLSPCTITCQCEEPIATPPGHKVIGVDVDGKIFHVGIMKMTCCGKLGRLGVATYRARIWTKPIGLTPLGF